MSFNNFPIHHPDLHTTSGEYFNSKLGRTSVKAPLYSKVDFNNGKKVERVEKVVEFDKNGNCKAYEQAVVEAATGGLIQKERRNNQNDKKVRIVEKLVEYDENGKCKAFEEAVVETAPDGRIYERRKGFEVCKPQPIWMR